MTQSLCLQPFQVFFHHSQTILQLLLSLLLHLHLLSQLLNHTFVHSNQLLLFGNTLQIFIICHIQLTQTILQLTCFNLIILILPF